MSTQEGSPMTTQQFRIEYDRLAPGYDGSQPGHWSHHVDEYSHRDRLELALDELAELVQSKKIRNVADPEVRDVTYSPWRDL